LIRFEKDFSELERLYLPLASDGESVDMIVAITVFFRLEMPSASNLKAEVEGVDRKIL